MIMKSKFQKARIDIIQKNIAYTFNFYYILTSKKKILNIFTI